MDTSSEVPWFAPGTYPQRVAFPPPSGRPLVLYFSRHARVAPALTGRGTHARRGSHPPAGGRTADEALEALGPLPVRASMGDGAGGLLGGRQLLGVFPARPGPEPGLPLGRRWPAGHLRRPVPPRLRARAVERARSDPQRAAVRPHRTGRQPRRGRQGAVLLPRLDADPHLPQSAAQVSPGGLPLRAPAGGEPPTRQGPGRVRARQYGGVRRGSLLRRGHRVREGLTRRRARPDLRCQSRGRAGGDPRAADPVVSQHLGLGPERRQLPAQAGAVARGLPGDPRRARDARRLSPNGGPGPGQPVAAAALHRERVQRGAAVRGAEPDAIREGRVPQGRHPGRRERREPGRARYQGGRLVPARARRGRGSRATPAAASGQRGRGTAVRRGIRPDLRRAHPRGGPLPHGDHSSGRDDRGACRAPAGAGRSPLVEAALLLRHPRLARGRPRSASAPGIAGVGAQRRLDALEQPRHPLDAGQMGVPVVRRVGPGVSHDPLSAARSRAREAPARAVAPRVVHAPQRADSGLRVRIRRRESTGARVGMLARVQDDGAPRAPRPSVPRADVPEVAPQLHVVGES